MKKLLSIIAALSMCAVLASCGNNNSDADTQTSAEAVVTTSAATETTLAETTAPDDTTAETVAETTVAEETTLSETTAEEQASESVAPTETTAEITEAETEPETDSAAEEEIVAEDVEDFTVSNSFADMDEFLAADIFMLDGKTVAADKSLSSSIFNTLDGDFYFETSEFDGSSSFKLAVKGNMIMTCTEADGKENKMIIRDSKAYTFDHENKVALFLPAEKELISQYAPEKMGIVPENISKESFVIADVTIGGKTYKFEYGTTSDWAMLYGADGKLYASVKSGDSLDMSLCKFSVTSKIPSGAFDIPDDYMPLDLEELMQNAPPPEDME